MRVLHFLPAYAPAWQFGGPILSVSRLCEGLAQHGIDVRVITTNAGLPDFPIHQLGTPQSVNGVEVIYYPVDHHGGIIRSTALVESLHDHLHWSDILHLSSIWQPLGIPVQKAAHALGVPVIQTLRGALGPYSWRRGWWKKVPYFWFRERSMLQKASFLHCTTRLEAHEIEWLRLKTPVKLLPNPVDTEQFSFDPDLGMRWRAELGLPLTIPLLAVIGRLHHKKGLDFLPLVLDRISHLDWNIIFIGNDDDGTLSRLQHKFSSRDLSHRFHWIPAIPSDQLAGPYNGSDCLLLPSWHENFGNVVVEALSCGCAALMSTSVGVSDLLESCPGAVTSDLTLSSWATYIEQILTMGRPGMAASRWISQRFKKSCIAHTAISYYAELINHD